VNRVFRPVAIASHRPRHREFWNGRIGSIMRYARPLVPWLSISHGTLRGEYQWNLGGWTLWRRSWIRSLS